MDRINKWLKSMETYKVRATLSYCPISQKMTLHLPSDTVFTISYHSAMGPMLRFRKSAITSPPAAAAAGGTREYFHSRVASHHRPEGRRCIATSGVSSSIARLYRSIESFVDARLRLLVVSGEEIDAILLQQSLNGTNKKFKSFSNITSLASLS